MLNLSHSRITSGGCQSAVRGSADGPRDHRDPDPDSPERPILLVVAIAEPRS
jgi:hypothetical protein